MTTSVDPNWNPSGSWDAGLVDLLERTDIFVPNDIEAGRIAHTSDVDAAVERLAGDGRIVVVKAGVRGAVAGVGVGGGVELHRVPALDVEVVDTTGAGDSFDAGLLAGWLGDRDLGDALRLANACGALSTRASGGVDAQPTLDEAASFLLQGSTP